MIARLFFPTFFFKTAVKQSQSDHRLESPEKFWLQSVVGNITSSTPRKRARKNYKQLKITKAEIWLSYSQQQEKKTSEDLVLYRILLSPCWDVPSGRKHTRSLLSYRFAWRCNRIWKCFHQKCQVLKSIIYVNNSTRIQCQLLGKSLWSYLQTAEHTGEIQQLSASRRLLWLQFLQWEHTIVHGQCSPESVTS